jgi:hypothetical protein
MPPFGGERIGQKYYKSTDFGVLWLGDRRLISICPGGDSKGLGFLVKDTPARSVYLRSTLTARVTAVDVGGY